MLREFLICDKIKLFVQFTFIRGRSKKFMEKLYTKIIGTPVFDEEVKHPITAVKDIVIDPETGKLLALIVNLSRNLVIAPQDILYWGDQIQVHTHDSIIEGNEILRVEEVQKKGIRIFNNRVVTKDGKDLGKVYDFTIDSRETALKKLYVAKSILGLVRYDGRIIPAKEIVEILPRKIVVNSDLATVTEKENAVVEDLAIS